MTRSQLSLSDPHLQQQRLASWDIWLCIRGSTCLSAALVSTVMRNAALLLLKVVHGAFCLSCLSLLSCSHAIVSSAVGPEYYVGITSFVDKTQLEPGCSVLLHNKVCYWVSVEGSGMRTLRYTLVL